MAFECRREASVVQLLGLGGPVVHGALGCQAAKFAEALGLELESKTLPILWVACCGCTHAAGGFTAGTHVARGQKEVAEDSASVASFLLCMPHLRMPGSVLMRLSHLHRADLQYAMCALGYV